MPGVLISAVEGNPPIPLDKAIMLIGRHPDCDIILQNNRKVSRRHCCIAQVNDTYVIRDLGSMNGVRVNGEEVIEAVLCEGDDLLIGDEHFRLQSREKASRPPKPVVPPVSPKAETAADPGLPPLPNLKKTEKRTPPAAPPRPPATPLDLSQEFPVAIPEPVEEILRPEDLEPDRVQNIPLDDEDDVVVLIEEDAGEAAAESVTPHSPIPFLVEDEEDDSQNHILKLDSGEINMRDVDPPSRR